MICGSLRGSRSIGAKIDDRVAQRAARSQAATQLWKTNAVARAETSPSIEDNAAL
jgi:hypothetical protein